MRYGVAEQEARYRKIAEDERSVDWKGESFDQFDLRPFLESVLASLPAGAGVARALEYGTGTGPGACFLAARGWRVDAIDISPTAIDIARRIAIERGLSVDFHVQDVCELAAPAETYDLVVDNYCLQRIVSDGDRSRALRAVRRTLKGEGIFVLGTALARDDRDLGADRFDEQSGVRYRRLEPSDTDYDDAIVIDGARFAPVRRYVTVRDLRAELERHGFTVSRQECGRVVCRKRGREP